MALDPREREQLHRLRYFWRAYGKQMTLTISIVLIVVVGFNIYTNYQNTRLSEAIELYEQFRQLDAAWLSEQTEQPKLAQPEARETNSSSDTINNSTPTVNMDDTLTAMEEVAELLRLDYTSSSHAAYANLRLAALYAQYDDKKEAQSLLQWVISHSESSQAVMRAALLLAQLLLEEEKAVQALAILDSQEDYSAASAELRGDILSSLAQEEEARAAYRQAIARGANKEFILYKMSLLPLME